MTTTGRVMIRYVLIFLFGILSFNANAQITQININTPGNIAYNIGAAPAFPTFFSVTHTGSGIFTEVFGFSLSRPGTENGILGMYEGVAPISFGLYNSSGDEVVEAEGQMDWASGEQYWVLPGQLYGGSYYFKIVGNADGVPNPFIASTYLFRDLISPVPEPSTYSLMLTGMLGIGYLVMRRARKTTAQQAFA
jgi:hypothetical protein